MLSHLLFLGSLIPEDYQVHLNRFHRDVEAEARELITHPQTLATPLRRLANRIYLNAINLDSSVYNVWLSADKK